MPFNRCANDNSGYCSGEPEHDVEPSDKMVTTEGGYMRGGHCRLDPNTCPKYQTFTESLRRQVDDTKARVEDWSKFKVVNELVATLTKLGK